jgi:DNA polymerase II small subunit/DNA polymerase delta subunit B
MENILGAKKINQYIENIEDSLYIEDSFGRQTISGNYPNYKKEEFISGIPLAIKGKINKDGVFIFDDYLFYENIKSKNDYILNTFNSPPVKIKNNNDENYVLFISNLKIGFPQEEEGFNESLRTLLIDFIQNRNNINNELKNYSDKIKRIILVGSSLNTNEKEIEKKIIMDNSSFSSQEINNVILENYITLNKFLNIISNYIHTDLMPSSDSKDDLLYPQNPLNKLLFSENVKNINNSVLNLVTNPYFFKLKLNSENIDKYFIGTSGENINIIKQYSCFENNIDIMKKNLEWKHLCPINPNYLNLYSSDNNLDPLIIQELPDVYFTSSDEKEFKYEKIYLNNKQIILMSLPDFSKSSKCILFNYEDNSYKIIEFKFRV